MCTRFNFHMYFTVYQEKSSLKALLSINSNSKLNWSVDNNSNYLRMRLVKVVEEN